MSAVVTISASLGASGNVIGRTVAEQLGLPFFDRAVPADEVKASQVCGLEVKARANAVVELRELRAKVAQGVLDLPVQPSAVRWSRPLGR